MSPFMNTKARRRAATQGGRIVRKSIEDNSKRPYRWLPSIDSAKWQEKYLFSVMELSKALNGFLVFEVAWKDIHGINYLNELQTETSLALEVKSMRKWEFYSPEQALCCASVWFSGRISEIQSLKDSFWKLSDFYDVPEWNFPFKDVPAKTSFEAFPDEDFSDVLGSPSEISEDTDSVPSCIMDDIRQMKTYSSENFLVNTCPPFPENRSLGEDEVDDESDIAPTQYSDRLLLLRFNDCLLPFKLRKVIVSDVRLLTLLESGLPTWVIFFQSYPLFCHFYHPWMRHLVRTLYILISLVTVIIGFYDLYKNVPPLKAAVARLCGPLFGWIEAWDMISRIRYLGTMLFLQNIEKGLMWIMVFVRFAKPIMAAITGPFVAPLCELAEFLSPLWNVMADFADAFSSALWFTIESILNTFADLFDVLAWPFEQFYSFACFVVHPLASSLWDFLVLPVYCMFTAVKYMVSSSSNAYQFLKDVWQSASSIFRLSGLSDATESAHGISIWQGLWNDLFSQVFRAARSIINVLLAFFVTCNRHRLSIYSHVQAFFVRLRLLIRLASGRRNVVHHSKEDGDAN